MRKVHFLRPGRCGLFENFRTYCDASVNYVRDASMRHVRTGARFDYTNDKTRVTCKTCLGNLKHEIFPNS